MSDKVIPMSGLVTTQNISADGVLNGAIEHGVDGIVVCGYDKKGGFYFASSYGNVEDTLYQLERAKYELMLLTSNE